MAYSEKQKFKPSNVNYTSKDFSTIKSDLIELISLGLGISCFIFIRIVFFIVSINR